MAKLPYTYTICPEQEGTSMTKELKRFEKWWDAEDDIPNDGPYTPDTPIQFAWAGWQAALAHPTQQKPVSWMCHSFGDEEVEYGTHQECENCIPLYTTPPQRRWVGLRDDEIYSVLENLQIMHHRPPTTDSRVIFARAIEAKLRSKNK